MGRATSVPSARVPLVESAAPAAESVFFEVRSRGQRVPNLYRALANAPRLLRPWVDFAWPLRRACASPRALRELAIVYLAQQRGSEYVHTHHVAFARDHGISDAQINALNLPEGSSSDCFSDLERTVLKLVDDIVSQGEASASRIEALMADVGPEQTVELVTTVAFFEAVCIVNRSLAVPLEQEDPGRSD